jgi:hypothetical protein
VVFFYQLDPAGEAKGLLEPPFEAFGHLVKPQDAGLKEPFVEGHPEFQFFKVVLLANIEEIFRSVAINLFEQNFDVIKRYFDPPNGDSPVAAPEDGVDARGGAPAGTGPGKKPGEVITRRGAPMVYGITIPTGSPNPRLAMKFVGFVLDPDRGMKVMEKAGQPSIVPSPSSTYDAIPQALRMFARPVTRGGDVYPQASGGGNAGNHEKKSHREAGRGL